MTNAGNAHKNWETDVHKDISASGPVTGKGIRPTSPLTQLAWQNCPFYSL